MRFAELSATLIIAACLATPAAAQNASQTQDKVFVEGVTACAVMFSERHPAANPPAFPPSSNPAIDNGYGKERAAAYGFKPLPVEDLMKAGWEAQGNMLGQRPRMELSKQGDWGRALITPSDLGCSFSMFRVREPLLDGDMLLATAMAWVARTYPGASIEGEAETRDERFDGPRGGKPSGLARTRWRSPDGMRLSLSITRPDGERGALIVSMSMNYLPARPQPAPQAAAPPT